MVKKKFLYKKYRDADQLRDIYQFCKDNKIGGLLEMIDFNMNDRKIVSYHPYYEYDLGHLIKTKEFIDDTLIRKYIIG